LSYSGEEGAALVALLRTQPEKTSWRKLTDRILSCGSAVDVWHSFHPQKLIPEHADAVAIEEAADDLAGWDSQGFAFLAVLDPRYPDRLRNTPVAPPFLFAKGDLREDDHAVAVVGSRKASPVGTAMARGISEALVDQQLAVVSGLAAGIDAAAHDAALKAGGRTVAFIATGINNVFPVGNEELQAKIADRGLLLSQFWPDPRPQKSTFLQRNALIAAYSVAAVVVEAGETSGARHLARQALEQSRPLILMERVTRANAWAKQLLSVPGVYLATGIEDVIEIGRELGLRPVADPPKDDSEAE